MTIHFEILLEGTQLFLPISYVKAYVQEMLNLGFLPVTAIRSEF